MRTVTPRASITTDPIEPAPGPLSTSSVAQAGCGSGATTTGSGDERVDTLAARPDTYAVT